MLEQLIGRIETARGELARDIAATPSPDYGTYRQACGRYQGLGEALHIIEDMLSREDDGTEDE